MLDRHELAARIDELESHLTVLAGEIEVTIDGDLDALLNELDALFFLRDMYYMEDEGFLEIRGGHVYPREPWCPNSL